MHTNFGGSKGSTAMDQSDGISETSEKSGFFHCRVTSTYKCVQVCFISHRHTLENIDDTITMITGIQWNNQKDRSTQADTAKASYYILTNLPITITDLLRNIKPSHVAHVEIPLPLNSSSFGAFNHTLSAPVAIIIDFVVIVPLGKCTL